MMMPRAWLLHYWGKYAQNYGLFLIKTFTTVEVDDNLPKSTKIDRSMIKSFSNIDGVIIDR